MTRPLLYEINTRCWLASLSECCGAPITLATVPDAQLDEWAAFGFTHIWLVGVWRTGPRAREKALTEPLRREYLAALPDWTETDVAGSPYAIADYSVAESLGGDEGLVAFRRRMHARGLRMLLDFVPNHLGLDHPWTAQLPELFVQNAGQAPEFFRQETLSGPKWLAHGKDPNFPAWTDTVQLDYRRGGTRARMTETLLQVAARCDGVRCDMAMLLLNDVFRRNWERFPVPGSRPSEEFWPGAIAAVKQRHPEFLFLAEVYWGLERRLQEQGFDYTYDKELYDRLVRRDWHAARQHIAGLPPEVIERGAHFLENHDERRIAAILDLDAHREAACLVLSLPGLRLLHEGQLTGMRARTPVQLRRRLAEPEDKRVSAMYRELLKKDGPV